MSRRRTAILGVVVFICGAISFFNARLTAFGKIEPEQNSSQQWLSDASETAVALESRINEEMIGLIANLADKRKSLGSVLEDPCSPDDIVTKHAENVIAAHERLMRRAGEHVLELRGKLPAGSCRQLMGLCAETVRGPMCRMGGRVGGGRQNGFTGPGPRGRGNGYGRGAGYGMRLRAKDRLARRLRLDEGQVSILRDKDPSFETDSERLRNILLAERAKLLALFEDPESIDEELLQQIDKLILAHSQIERRIAKHVLVLRPYLTVEQQKWLIGLCRRSQDDQVSF